MQIPIIPRRGQLGSIPRIDWSNPLTAGLIGGYLPGVMKGHAIVGPNLSNGDGGSGSWATTAEGAALGSTTASSNNGLIGPAPAAFTGTAFSIYWRGVVLGNPDAHANLVGITFTNSDTNPFAVWVIAANADWTQAELTWNTAGTAVNLGFVDLSTNFGKTVGLAATFKTGGTSVFYMNGVSQLTQAFGAGAPTKGTPQIVIDQYLPGNGRTANAKNNVVFFWNRQLSALEIQTLDADPYCFLTCPEDEMFATLVGVIGGGGISVTSDSGAPFEFISSLRRDGLAPLESLAAVRIDRPTQLEDLAGVRAERGEQLEVLAGIQGNSALGLETTGLFKSDAAGSLETTSAARSDATGRLETLAGQRSDMLGPIETLASVRNDSAPQTENQGTIGVTGNGTIQIETTGAFKSDATAGLEELAAARTDALALLEVAAGAQGNAAGALESTNALRSDATAQNETTSAFRSDTPARLETLAGQRSDAVALAETLAGVSAEHLAGLESGGGIIVTGNAAVQLEFTAPVLITGNAAVQLEFTGTALPGPLQSLGDGGKFKKYKKPLHLDWPLHNPVDTVVLDDLVGQRREGLRSAIRNAISPPLAAPVRETLLATTSSVPLARVQAASAVRPATAASVAKVTAALAPVAVSDHTAALAAQKRVTLEALAAQEAEAQDEEEAIIALLLAA